MRMEWVSVKDELPKKDGVVFVFAPSLDPKKPFYSTAFWSMKNQRFELIPRSWSRAITHWLIPTTPEEIRGACEDKKS